MSGGEVRNYKKGEAVRALKAHGRAQMAAILEQHWSCSIVDYSSSLLEDPCTPAIEPELTQAFEEECQRLGHCDETAQLVRRSLERTGVLQTATHLTLSEGPTFLAVHRLAVEAIPENEYYVVGAFSGVPFSNSAWPGCFNYSDRYSASDILESDCPGFRQCIKAEKDRRRDTSELRISGQPGNMRDGRVYRSDMPRKLQQMLPFVRPKLAPFMPAGETERSFTKWALRCAERQLVHHLSRTRIVYLDINEIIASYLQKVIGNSSHPLHRLFFSRSLQREISALFGHALPMFTVGTENRGRWRQENVYLEDGQLRGRSTRMEMSEDNLLAGLKSGHLCPGLFLTFVTLSFINGLKCLGSFDQVEYLREYQVKLGKIRWLDRSLVEEAATRGLTTGRCVDWSGKPLFSLDLVLGSEWEYRAGQTLGNWLQPVLRGLIR